MRIAVFLQRNAWVRRQGVVCDSRLTSSASFSYPEPFLRAVRRGALAKSITGYLKKHGNRKYPVLDASLIWIWPEPLVALR